ncbi:MAG TPA: ABC transporter substrate-binding protein, partial [Mycobacteriales bacterium]|nr:ABC transporter substrate-binding protein [Mycobacteriales bacterium]
AQEDTIGISNTEIKLCAHAALTYGAAFQTTEEDFDVFWDALNDAGGIYGRKVVPVWKNDDYKPDVAVRAATACKDENAFLLLSGLGFDQIPAVRNWAERERMLYIHSTATVKGTAGQRYSFAPLPSVERTGEAFAQLYLSKYRGKRIGIIKRASENWEPGVEAFKASLGNAGKIVAEKAVVQNKGNYSDEVAAMKNAKAEVIWIWENALMAIPIVQQIRRQEYNPNMMLFSFNLTSQTLQEDAFNPTLDGVAMFTAYSQGDYAGPFSSYADDIRQFEAQYAKYRPAARLDGYAGDLLFANWSGQKALYQQLLACGRDCTRNRFVSVLENFRQRPTSSYCPLDYTVGNRRQGSDKVVFMETYRAPGVAKVNWRNTQMCVGRG